jgi:hypothetical protein
VNAQEQIYIAFHATLTPEEVFQYLKVLDKSGLLVLLLGIGSCIHSMMSAPEMSEHAKWKYYMACFNTAAGQYYETEHTTKVLFTLLPEFSESNILHWKFHLDPEKESQGTGYDMILGIRDLMQALVVPINNKLLRALWEDIHIGIMHDFFAHSKKYRVLHMIMQQSTKPPSNKE